jgi:CelD/BcsL family acetyltransferase involved in cellulose biosynthesis/SAM-dependent methyltransferase
VTITVVRPSELGPAEVTAWHDMQAKSPPLANPFLSPEFTLAVGRLRPSARVAVLTDGPDITGFFPFERRGLGVGVPIAAGLTDCQGLVHLPGIRWDARMLLKACGISAWQFDHLVADQEPFGPYRIALAPSPVVDLSGGFAAYHDGLRSCSPGFVSALGRKTRKLAREVGELRLVAASAEVAELRTLMAWKSGQYRRTGRLDRFSHSWIVELLDSLLVTQAAALTGVLSVLYAGRTPVAAHFGLRAGEIMTYWFPAYDTDFSKYSPGLILQLKLAEKLAADGVTVIDLGKGKMQYKETLKTGELLVAEGIVTRRSPLGAAHWARWVPQAWVIRQIRAHPPLFRTADAMLRYGAQARSLLPHRSGSGPPDESGGLPVIATPNRSRLSYKLAFAARHPDQILPYLRRVAVDARLRARTEDHVSYYRAVMRYKAGRSLDLAVGSRSPAQGAEFGRMQFDYLVRHGLARTGRLLEIGCGNLRAGRFLIDYLDVGNYYGIDISPDVLLSAQRVLAENKLQEKMPRLVYTDDLKFGFLPADYFDVIHANSVFTHCPIEIIEECFAHVGRIMAPGGFFDFTFYRTEDAEYQVHREDFYYRTETLIALADRYGLGARLMDDWLDPWDKQPKIRITRTKSNT